MSKIVVENSNSLSCACTIRFPKGHSTKIVYWEYGAIKKNGRLFVFLMLLQYSHGFFGIEYSVDYYTRIQLINKL